jgi:hypothetical protein
MSITPGPSKISTSIYHAAKSRSIFHGNLRKIHLNQLSNLGSGAKLPAILIVPSRQGRGEGNSIDISRRGDDAIVLESKACITLAESISATRRLSALLSL